MMNLDELAKRLSEAQLAYIASLEHDHKLMKDALKKYDDKSAWIKDDFAILPNVFVGDGNNGFDLARTALQKLEVKDE